MNPVLQAERITKYFQDPEPFAVLDDVSFSVGRGEFLALVGKSGSGKSTLLYVLSTMDTAYQGRLLVEGQLLTGQDGNQLSRFRNAHIGFVFQFHYLLPEFTCLQNVMLPALKQGKHSRADIEEHAYARLKLLDVHTQALKPAHKLSGGQQQRVAIARALINNPTLIMGDEPTGNLDSKNSENVFEIFQHLAHAEGQTIIVVTHDEAFARRTDRILELSDGHLVS